MARNKRIGGYRLARSRQASLRKVSPPPARKSPKGAAAKPAETLTEQAYRVIEEQIVTLRLKPGEILSEQMLSATYAFGRTPIREALQRLAREGLITIFPRKGILVSDLNPRNQLLVLEVRRELERLLSRAGAERATKAAARAAGRHCAGNGSSRQDHRRHRVHAARSRAQRADDRGGP